MNKRGARDAGARLTERIRMGQQAYSAGDTASAAEHWGAALRSAQRLPVPENLVTTLRNNLAGVYHSLGKRESARRLYRAALEDAQRKHGESSAPVATILNNMAELERAAGKLETAGLLFRRALIMAENAGMAEEALVGMMANRAQCLGEVGKTEEAAALYARAIALAQTKPGVSAGTLGVLWNNAAGLAAVRAQWDESLAAYGKAVALLTQAGDSMSAQRKQAMVNFAAALRRYAQELEQLAGER